MHGAFLFACYFRSRAADPSAETVCMSLRATLQPLVDNGTFTEVLNTTDHHEWEITDAASVLLSAFLEEVLGEESEGGELVVESLHCFDANSTLRVYMDSTAFTNTTIALFPELLEVEEAQFLATVLLGLGGETEFQHMQVEGFVTLSEVRLKVLVTLDDSGKWTVAAQDLPNELDLLDLVSKYNYTLEDMRDFVRSTIMRDVSFEGGYDQEESAAYFKFKGTVTMEMLPGGNVYDAERQAEFTIFHSVKEQAVFPFPFLDIPLENNGPCFYQLAEAATGMQLNDSLDMYFDLLEMLLLHRPTRFVMSLTDALGSFADPEHYSGMLNVAPTEYNGIGLWFDPGDFPAGVYAIFDTSYEGSTARVGGRIGTNSVLFSVVGGDLFVRDVLEALEVPGAALFTALDDHSNVYEANFLTVAAVDLFAFNYSSMLNTTEPKVMLRSSAPSQHSHFKNFTSFNTTEVDFYIDLATRSLSSEAKADLSIGEEEFRGTVVYDTALGSFTVRGCLSGRLEDANSTSAAIIDDLGLGYDLPALNYSQTTYYDPLELFTILDDVQMDKAVDALHRLNLFPFNLTGLCYQWKFGGFLTAEPSVIRAVGESEWPMKISEDALLGTPMTINAHYKMASNADSIFFTTVLSIELEEIYLPIFFEHVTQTYDPNSLLLQTQLAGLVVDVDGTKEFADVMDASPFLAKLNPSTPVSLGMGFRWPRLCYLDSYCNVLTTFYGNDSTFFFTGGLDLPSNETTEDLVLQLFSPASDFQLARNILVSSNIQMQYGGNSSSIDLKPSMRLTEPPIQFIGDIRFVGADVTLSMVSQDCWDRPFGYPWLRACNMTIDTVIRQEQLPMEAMGLLATLTVGLPNCTQLSLLSFFGLNFTDTDSDYFMVTLGEPIPLIEFLQLFCFQGQLPKLLEDTLLLEVEISESPFALQFASLEDQDFIYLPQGFAISGTILLGGEEGQVTITVNDPYDPSSLQLQVQLEQLELHLSTLRIRRKHSEDPGPRFFVNIALKETIVPRMWIEGEMETLGTTQQSQIRVTSTSLQVNLRGFLFDEYDATVILFGQFKDTFDTARFKVLGHFNRALLNRLDRTVTDNIEALANGAAADLRYRRDLVSKAEETYQFALDAVAAANVRVQGAEANVTAQRSALDNLQTQKETVCSHQSCDESKRVSACALCAVCSVCLCSVCLCSVCLCSVCLCSVCLCSVCLCSVCLCSVCLCSVCLCSVCLCSV